jgi:transformer-2 protein
VALSREYITKIYLLKAKERANGMELDGRRIRVDFSITKRPHTPTPGIYMGRPT